MDREELIARLGSLHEAASAERWSDVEQGLRALDEAKAAAFAEGIRKMAVDLHKQMRALQLDNRLAKAAAEIPDACARLDAVIELTEDAATRTMDLVEDSRGHVVLLQAMADHHPTDPEWRQVQALSSELRKNMSSLYEAQAYQDLSGQIIRRVIGIVSSMDGALSELLELAGIERASIEVPADDELMGPVAGRTDDKPAASQDDADALLADLGL